MPLQIDSLLDRKQQVRNPLRLIEREAWRTRNQVGGSAHRLVAYLEGVQL